MSGMYTAPEHVAVEVIPVTDLGSGLRLVDRRQMNFTIQEAEKLLTCEEFIGDRTLRDSHVDYLIKAMKRGTFRPEQVQLVTCKHDGKTWRMNGQHTAWARVHMPPSFECKVTILEYTAKTMEDMRILYSSIDRGAPRTRANVIDSYLAGTEEFEGIKSATLRVVPQGFAMWRWTKAERRNHDADDVAYLLKTEEYDLTRKVSSFLDAHVVRDSRHVLRAPVVAAMFATFHKAPQIALDFWTPVVTGTGIDKVGDPRLKLRNELQRVAVDSGGGSHSVKKAVSQEFMYRQCLVGWNAFREGRSIQYLKASEKGARPGVK